MNRDITARAITAYRKRFPGGTEPIAGYTTLAADRLTLANERGQALATYRVSRHASGWCGLKWEPVMGSVAKRHQIRAKLAQVVTPGNVIGVIRENRCLDFVEEDYDDAPIYRSLIRVGRRRSRLGAVARRVNDSPAMLGFPWRAS